MERFPSSVGAKSSTDPRGSLETLLALESITINSPSAPLELGTETRNEISGGKVSQPTAKLTPQNSDQDVKTDRKNLQALKTIYKGLARMKELNVELKHALSDSASHASLSKLVEDSSACLQDLDQHVGYVETTMNAFIETSKGGEKHGKQDEFRVWSVNLLTNLQGEIDSLRAQNAKLRVEIKFLQKEVRHSGIKEPSSKKQAQHNLQTSLKHSIYELSKENYESFVFKGVITVLNSHAIPIDVFDVLPDTIIAGQRRRKVPGDENEAASTETRPILQQLIRDIALELGEPFKLAWNPQEADQKHNLQIPRFPLGGHVGSRVSSVVSQMGHSFWLFDKSFSNPTTLQLNYYIRPIDSATDWGTANWDCLFNLTFDVLKVRQQMSEWLIIHRLQEMTSISPAAELSTGARPATRRKSEDASVASKYSKKERRASLDSSVKDYEMPSTLTSSLNTVITSESRSSVEAGSDSEAARVKATPSPKPKKKIFTVEDKIGDIVVKTNFKFIPLDELTYLPSLSSIVMEIPFPGSSILPSDYQQMKVVNRSNLSTKNYKKFTYRLEILNHLSKPIVYEHQYHSTPQQSSLTSSNPPQNHHQHHHHKSSAHKATPTSIISLGPYSPANHFISVSKDGGYFLDQELDFSDFLIQRTLSQVGPSVSGDPQLPKVTVKPASVVNIPSGNSGGSSSSSSATSASASPYPAIIVAALTQPLAPLPAAVLPLTTATSPLPAVALSPMPTVDSPHSTKSPITVSAFNPLMMPMNLQQTPTKSETLLERRERRSNSNPGARPRFDQNKNFQTSSKDLTPGSAAPATEVRPRSTSDLNRAHIPGESDAGVTESQGFLGNAPLGVKNSSLLNSRILSAAKLCQDVAISVETPVVSESLEFQYYMRDDAIDSSPMVCLFCFSVSKEEILEFTRVKQPKIRGRNRAESRMEDGVVSNSTLESDLNNNMSGSSVFDMIGEESDELPNIFHIEKFGEAGDVKAVLEFRHVLLRRGIDGKNSFTEATENTADEELEGWWILSKIYFSLKIR